MIRFNTQQEAQAFVTARVTCERTDEGGQTHWEVVDRLAAPRLILSFDDELIALEARDSARIVRLLEATVYA